MSETTSTPFEKWYYETKSMMEHCWRAALEWAAGQVESVGCDCGGVPHADSCPVELAAKIREGTP